MGKYPEIQGGTDSHDKIGKSHLVRHFFAIFLLDIFFLCYFSKVLLIFYKKQFYDKVIYFVYINSTAIYYYHCNKIVAMCKQVESALNYRSLSMFIIYLYLSHF